MDIVNSPSAITARTMLGGASGLPVPPPLLDDMPTLVKPPKKAVGGDPQRTKLGLADDPAPRPRMPSQLQNTVLGGVLPPELLAPNGAQEDSPKAGANGASDPAAAEAGRKKSNDPREMPHELGATLVPQVARPVRKPNRELAERLDPQALLLNKRDKLAQRRIMLPPARSREEIARREAQKRRRKAMIFVGAGLALLTGGLMLASFLNAPSSLSARVRVLPDGHEAVEVTCSTCPDGTRVLLGDATATMTAHLAQIPLVAPLALGENRLKIAVDRPASGRDETVEVDVKVGYRLRPDLAMLNSDKPTLHIAIEALAGTEITLGGQVVKIEDGSKAHAIDVSADCTGSSDEPATLKRSVPYVVKSRDGKKTDGVVDIAVGIVPLRIDAPGPRVVTESDTFVLSGHTSKGAEVLVAGRPIQVSADGAFGQRMSVSSIGATNIEVRAKIPGMAPRIVPIAVQRVQHLEEAAKEFQKEKPVGYSTVALASSADVGRPVVVTGQIAEVRVQNVHQTVFMLEVPSSEGCGKLLGKCRVRLVQGAASTAKVGDSLTAYGQIGRPWATPGAAALPEIQVAFTLPGPSGAAP
jgi:hypothetical protein